MILIKHMAQVAFTVQYATEGQQLTISIYAHWAEKGAAFNLGGFHRVKG